MKTEKDFLNTIETYIQVTINRLKDGRIITAHEELGILLKLVRQRQEEVPNNTTDTWMNADSDNECEDDMK